MIIISFTCSLFCLNKIYTLQADKKNLIHRTEKYSYRSMTIRPKNRFITCFKTCGTVFPIWGMGSGCKTQGWTFGPYVVWVFSVFGPKDWKICYFIDLNKITKLTNSFYNFSIHYTFEIKIIFLTKCKKLKMTNTMSGPKIGFL